MSKIDIIRKLASRKFWVALVSIVTGIILMTGAGEDTVQQVSGTIMAVGSTVAYIIGESWTDVAN